jgi:hypothetical protein
VAACLDISCESATASTLDSIAVQYNEMTIGGDMLPLLAYHDAANGDLKVAHCTNAACTP